MSVHILAVNPLIKELFHSMNIFVQWNMAYDKWSGNLSFADSLVLNQYSLLAGTSGRLYSIGSFSYCQSALPLDIHIGSYCSIAKGVTVMASGHPLDRFTTSPVTYHAGKFGFSPLAAGLLEPAVNSAAEKNFSYQRSLDNEEFSPVAWSERRPPIIIGNDVWIGADVLLKPGVSIGDGAIIAARAVVTKDVEPFSIVGGVPAKRIRKRYSDVIEKRLEQLKWWTYPYYRFQGIKGDEPIEQFIEKVSILIESGRISPFEPKTITAEMILSATP